MTADRKEQANSCNRCGKPRRVENSGTLTGWIFDAENCRCDLSLLESASQVTTASIVCLNCNKPILARQKATITQWIFRRDTCSCGSRQNPSQTLGPPDAVQAENVEFDFVAAEVLPQQNEVPERYRLMKELGRGAQSVVYEAFDSILRRRVAIKVLDKLSMDPKALVRFQNEAKVTCRLDHPNIVQVLDFGINQSNQPFMVLEHVTGVTLRQTLKDTGPLDSQSAAEVFHGVASALSRASSQGIFHRDLKPENLLIHTDESSQMVPKLIDFGLAKYVQSTNTIGGITLVGTPAYMSPDQANNLPFDVRSEMYSFGCVLFEALTGRPVFQSETALTTLALHRDAKPDRVIDLVPEVAPALNAIVAKCLEKLPENRFKSFDEIVSLLDSGDLSETIKAQEAEVVEKQKRIPAILIVCVFLGLFGIGAVTLVSMNNRASAPVQPTLPPAKIESQKPTEKAIVSPLPAAGPLVNRDGSPGLISTFRSDNMISQIAMVPWVAVSEGGTAVRLRGNFLEKHYKLIPKSTKLKDLDAFDGQHLDAKGFDEVVGKMRLRSINICESDADDRIAHTIAGMKTVNRVLLKGTNITDKGLIEVASLPLLTELCIDRCNVTDNGIAALAKCKMLRRLSINSLNNLSANGLKALRPLKLNELLCSNNKLTKEELQEIAQLKVAAVYISNCNIDDDKTQFLVAKNSRIEGLNVTRNPITIKGLATLLRLPLVNTITLSPATDLSKEAIDDLKKSMGSKCKVEATLGTSRPLVRFNF